MTGEEFVVVKGDAKEKGELGTPHRYGAPSFSFSSQL